MPELLMTSAKLLPREGTFLQSKVVTAKRPRWMVEVYLLPECAAITRPLERSPLRGEGVVTSIHVSSSAGTGESS